MAIGAGLIVLIGYFIPAFDLVRVEMIQWAVVAGGAAVLVGIGNLFSVHFQRVRRREKDSPYSMLLLVSMLGTLLIGMLLTPFHPIVQLGVEGIIFPVEASLMALLAVTLVYASIRLLRRRADWMSIVFLGSALIVMIGSVSLPFFGMIPVLSDWIAPWLTYGIAPRGLLLGVALGALTTGLRVLFGIDRPYGGK
jgi:hypothetical protein